MGVSRKKIILFLIFFISLLFSTKVYALDIKATGISLIDKSSTAEVDTPEIINNEISSKIILNKVNDYAVFDLTITNNEKNGFKIESITDNNENEYITTSYDYDKDYFTGDSKVKIKFLYKNVLKNVEKVSLDDLVITIKLVNDKGESTNIIINNPKTGDNILLYSVILIVGVLGLIYLKKKIRFKDIKIGAFILLIPILLLPFVIFALDRYEIPVKFKHIEAKGDFDVYDVMVEGIGIRQVVHGNEIGDLPVQDKDGYSFNGYEDEDGIAVSEDTIVTRPMTVKPMYTIITYNITYNLNGGVLETPNPDTYTVEDTITLNNPTKLGYTFSGWTGSNGNILQTEVTINNKTGDLNFIANYSANPNTPYKVIHRYPNLDNTYVEEIESLFGATDTTVRPQTRDKTGFNSPEMQDLLIKADGTSELIYNYTRINYNLTLLHPEDIDSIFTTGSYPYQTVITVKANDKPGYTFSKWSDNEPSKEYTFELVKDTVLYPIYTPNTDTPYKVIHKKMDLDGVNYTVAEIENLVGVTDSEVTPSTKTYEGFDSPTARTVTIAADGSTEVEYLYTRKKYNLTVEDPEKVEEDKTGEYYYGTEITVVAKDILGYTFTGWQNGGNTKTYTFVITEDKTIKPLYEPKADTPYKVIHKKMNLDGATYTVAEIENLVGVTDSEVTPNTKTYEGFKKPATKTVPIAADGSTEIEYLYERNKYNLTVEDPEKVEEDKTGEYYYGTEITVVAKDIQGYTFTGWQNGGNTKTYTFIITEDKTIKPLFTPGDATPYKVIHKKMNLDGSTYTVAEIENLTGVTGEEVTPNTKTYEGFKKPETKTVPIAADGSTEIEYLYERNKYNLTVEDPEKVEEDKTGEYYYGTEITVVAKDIPGYTFTGWQNGENTKTYTFIITEDKTIKPLYTPGDATPYKVIHKKMNLDGSTYTVAEIENLSGVTGTEVTPNTKTYEGFDSPETKTVPIAADGSTEITYEYTRKKYSLIYVDEDKIDLTNSSEPKKYYYESEVTAIAKDIPGYTFVSWNTGDTTKQITKIITDDLVLNPIYKANNYTIIFNNNTGTGLMDNEEMTYDVSKALTRNSFTKPGYEFVRWNTSVDGTGSHYEDEETVINLATDGSITLYAEWKYVAEPTITRDDYNTFTVNAPSGNKYIISKTQTTKPTASSEGWSTATSQDTSTNSKETWYLWVQDENGKISDKHAEITNYKVTLTAGEGTTLTAKADSDTTGDNIESGSYVLNETPVYPTGTPETGYHNLIVKKGTSTIPNGSAQVIEEDTTFTSSASETSAPSIVLIDHNTFSYDAEGAAAYYVSTSNAKPTAGNSASSTFALDTWTTAINTGDLTLGAGQTYYVWSESSITGGAVSLSSASIGVNEVTRVEGTGTTLTTKYDSSTGEVFTNTPTYVLTGSEITASAELQTGYKELVIKKNSTEVTSGKTHKIEEDTEFTTSSSEITEILTYNANGHGTSLRTVTMKYTEETIAAEALSADGYRFVGWNTEADGTGTTYQVGDIVKAANEVPVNMTLYANWEYIGEPTITVNDYNKFTASAIGADKYLISSTQSTKPTSSSSGWSTSGSSGALTLTEGQIYYVWVQDADGKISSNYATIGVKTITENIGVGTTLVIKNGGSSGAALNFSSNKANVLAGTTIYASADLETGYDSLVFTKDMSPADNDASYTINEDTLFATSATEKTALLTYNANGHGVAPANVTMKYTETVSTAAALTEENYTFVGWNTKADGSGTSYDAEKIIKEANKVPNDTTLYAIWVYTATPIITVNDHNTFTASAPSGDKYIISKTQTTKPTSSTTGWSTTTSQDASTSAKETWYVWVQDADEKISENYAIIENYKITLTEGEGTSLNVKADNDTTGTNIASGNYVLDGTTVYPTGTLETGYHSLIVKKNTTTIVNGHDQVIEGDTTFTTSATATSAPTITLVDHNTFSYSSDGGAAYYISTSNTKPAAGNSASTTFALNTWTTASNTGNLTLAAGQTYYVWSESSTTGGTVSASSASIGVNKVSRNKGTGTTLTTIYDSSTGEEFTDSPVYVLYGSQVYAESALQTGYDSLVMKKNSTNITSGDTHLVNGDITFITSSSEKTSTLTYNANGHGTAPSSVTMKYTEATSAAPALTEENYTFAGWNTKADGSGTSYDAGDVVKAANKVPVDMTLYAIWEYNAEPTITVNDYNTFTASAPLANKYLISSTQTTKPTGTEPEWTTITSQDSGTSSKETWYVWVQDADGKVSNKHAEITNYKVTLSAGVGTNLTAKADNETTGTNIISGSYVLSGTTVYPTGTLETGYENLVIKKGASPITNGSAQIINVDTTFTSSSSAGSLTFNSQSLQSGTYGTAYTSDEFEPASGGTGSYSYALVSGYPTGATISDRTISFTDSTPAGLYEIDVIATDLNSGAIATATMSIYVYPKNLTITANDQTIVYGNTISKGLSDYSITTGELAASDHISSISLEQSTNSITETGTITPSLVVIQDSSDNVVTSNYNITYEDGLLKVQNASISFNSNGGTPPSGYFYTKKGETGITNKGHYSTTYTTDPPIPTKAGFTLRGWYTASTGGEKIKNPDFSFAGTPVSGYVTSNSWDVTEDKVIYAQWDVNPLEFNDQTLSSVTYGTAYTSNEFVGASNGSGSYTYTLQSGYPEGANIDSNNRTITMPYNTPAGTYNIVVRVTDNESGSIMDATMTVTVNPKQLSVTWGDSAWTYDGGVHATSALASTGVTGETITLAINGTNSITNVGTSALTASCSSATSSCSNYTLINTSKTLSVTPRTLTVTAAAKSRQYSDANPAFTYSYSGQVSGQTPGFTGALTTSATTATAIGQYDITKGSLALANNGAFLASNYTMSYVGAKLTINRKTTATTGACLNPTYNGSAQNLAGGGANVTYSGNSQTNVGASNYTVTVTPNANYAWSDGTYGAKTLSCNLQKKQLPAPTLTPELYNLAGYVNFNKGTYATGLKYRVREGTHVGNWSSVANWGAVDISYTLSTEYKNRNIYVDAIAVNTTNLNYTSESTTATSVPIVVVQIVVTAQTGASSVGGSAFRFVGLQATINASCATDTPKFSKWKIKPTGGDWQNWDQCTSGTEKNCTFEVKNKEYNLGAYCRK